MAMEPQLSNNSFRRKLGWLVIFLLIFAGYLQYHKTTRPNLGTGILVPEDPEMMPVNYAKPWAIQGYTITPLASYNIRARVLETKRYYWDREADLSPVDVVLGWGAVSGQEVLDNISISQSHRDFSWKANGPLPITEEYVISHCVNMHLIPANNAIKEVIKSLRAHRIINMSGYLVGVSAKDHYTWTSTISSSSKNKNKIFWVDSITIIKN